jgi:intracellular multiplication protein IcmE
MNSQTIDPAAYENNDEMDEGHGSPNIAPPKRKIDGKASRNLMIVGAVVILAIIVIVILAFQLTGNKSTSQGTPTEIKVSSNNSATNKAAELTEAEEERLKRVQSKESDKAASKGEVFVPNDNPMKATPTEPLDNGPGKGYNYQTGNESQSAAQTGASNPERDSLMIKGMESQLKGLLSRYESPSTQKAAAYAVDKSAETNGAQAPSTTATEANIENLMAGLTIAGARLVSPMDTAKTSFVSAEITTGPLNGAYLIGTATMNGELGVLVKFNRMRFKADDYAVDVTGLDSQTSSNALNADIDRKILARFVMPVIYASAQAYMTALARPSQNIVNSTSGSTVATPGATTLQATASGVAAGLGQLIASGQQQTPSAFLPVNSSIALLFNAAVPKKAK